MNEVTKFPNLPECPKYFFLLPTTYNQFYKLKMILNEVTKLLNLP